MTKLKTTKKKSKNRLLSSILFTKQDDGSFLVIDMENEKVFYRIEGDVACDAFELLAGNKKEDLVFKTLLKKYPEAPENDLSKDFKSFIKSLVKAKVFAAYEN